MGHGFKNLNGVDSVAELNSYNEIPLTKFKLRIEGK